MGLVQRFKDSVMDFGAIPTTADASQMSRNPIAKSVENLIKNPQYTTVGKLEYIKFGDRDNIDEVIEILKGQSTTHSGIINRKAKMVAGNDLKAVGKIGNKKTAWEAFEKSAGGSYGKALESEWKKIANLYETYGAVGILIKTDGGTTMTSIKALSPRKIRIGRLTTDNEIDHFIVRSTFSKTSSKIYKGTEREVVSFDPNNDSQKESLLYVVNPATENDFYGLPNYIAAFHFISADNKFGVTIHNSAENGFQPKVMLTFIGRNMSQEQKDTHAEQIKSNFVAADGETVIVNYIRREEEMPKVDSLAVANLDKTIATMANLNDSKILTAHSITNPTLFGVSVAGKLGNSGTELESAYNIFRATETLPNRKLLLDALTLAFTGSNFDGIKFEVEDIDVSPQENRGDNVESEDDKEKEDKDNENKEDK